MRREERIRQFVGEIWQWYARHKRTLPWRDLAIADNTQRAYMILVSEVMLQQTQVSRVQIIFKQFIARFPTIKDIARASNRDVLIAWRGMGYNSRALRLRDAARVIGQGVTLRCEPQRATKGDTGCHGSWLGSGLAPHHDKLFPRSMEALLQIPGIGPYTAAAIRNFAFNLPTPCIDTNIRRILHRTFVGPERADGTWEKDDQYLLKLAEEVLRIALEAPHPNPLPRGEGICAQWWHAALMDFGSLVCAKRSPKCAQCPLSQGMCRSAFRVDRATSKRATSKREQGRLVGGRFVPNRIVRGKIVDLLRDHPRGLTLAGIGREICLDWLAREHTGWLRGILDALEKEELIQYAGRGRYVLG